MSEKKDIAWFETKAKQIAHYLWDDQEELADIEAKQIVDAGSYVEVFDNSYTRDRLDGGKEYNREIIVKINGQEFCRKSGDHVFERAAKALRIQLDKKGVEPNNMIVAGEDFAKQLLDAWYKEAEKF